MREVVDTKTGTIKFKKSREEKLPYELLNKYNSLIRYTSKLENRIKILEEIIIKENS